MVGKLKALLVIALCFPLVGAWPNTGKKYPPIVAAAASACSNGPGDVVASASAWWGLRGYTNAICTTGTQAVANLRRASDNHTCDVLVAATALGGNTSGCSTGGDNGQSASAFCNATTCSITKLYDQTVGNGCNSASCDVAQATAALQPTITFSGLGSNTVITGSGSQYLQAANTLASTPPVTFEVMAENTKTTQSVMVGVASTQQLGFRNAGANTVYIFAGAVASVTAADSAAHALTGVIDATGVACAVNVDGTDSTGLNCSNVSSTNDPFFMSDNSTNDLKGFQGEAGIWMSAFNATQRANMCHNIFTFWGTATSC